MTEETKVDKIIEKNKILYLTRDKGSKSVELWISKKPKFDENTGSWVFPSRYNPNPLQELKEVDAKGFPWIPEEGECIEIELHS